MTEQMDTSGRVTNKLKDVRDFNVPCTPEPVTSSDTQPCKMNSMVSTGRDWHTPNCLKRFLHSVLGSFLHPIARDGVHAQVCSAHSRLHLLLSIRRLVEQGSSCRKVIQAFINPPATTILYQGD